MQLNLDLDLNTMNEEQREAVAAFIINYPTVDIVGVAQEIPKSPARSFADVVRSETAQEDTQGRTLTPVPSAPIPPVANLEIAAGTVVPLPGSPAEVDKDGLPWDARIHSSTRSKVVDGTWKKKRGVTPVDIAHVETELRKLMGNDTPVIVQMADGQAINAVVNPGPSLTIVPDLKQQFVQLVGRSSEAIKAGKLSQVEINACCNAYGLAALPLLATKLELVPQVAADIDAIIASRP